MKKISILINADDRLGHISPEIYGHFSEHLGRCIYNGIYVGENSPIPNTDGIRNDIIEAFRNIKAPVFRWPGGLRGLQAVRQAQVRLFHWRRQRGQHGQSLFRGKDPPRRGRILPRRQGRRTPGPQRHRVHKACQAGLPFF